MIGTAQSASLVGVEAHPVHVEVDLSRGLPGYHVVGMPATSVREGAVRIRAALDHCGLRLPLKKITVNLAPADLKKCGTAFDLPIALSVLAADGVIPPTSFAQFMVLGELGLDGSVRSVPGVLAAAIIARRAGCTGMIVPRANVAAARQIEGLEVYAGATLAEIVAGLQSGRLPESEPIEVTSDANAVLDMDEVRGQAAARRALEIAVAGGHHVLLTGPPGIGKTMLAQRIPTILPELTRDEAMETTLIHSSAGLGWTGGLIRARPFRAPHHTISGAGLLGGGSIPRPGEISLAHNGVLFLDELPEFKRATLEGLRQPFEDRFVVIGRAHGSVRIPAAFLMVAAANPCPCGYLASGMRECTCSQVSLERYRDKLSGPLLDRVDLQVFVRPPELAELRSDRAEENSATIRARVAAARARQAARLAPWGIRANATMTTRAMRATCALDGEGERVIRQVHEKRKMSARRLSNLLKVARTLADLDGVDAIRADDIREAAAYRAWDQAG